MSMKSPLPDYESQILALGWDTESVSDSMKAQQGGFSTPWRSSWAEVLTDVQQIKQTKPKETNDKAD